MEKKPEQGEVELSAKELEIVRLWRRIGYGTILIEFRRGEPIVSTVVMKFRHGKLAERGEALELLPELQRK